MHILNHYRKLILQQSYYSLTINLIKVFCKSDIPGICYICYLMRNLADAEVARHASRWMILVCNTSHYFHFPLMVFLSRIWDHKILRSGRLLHAVTEDTGLSRHLPISTDCIIDVKTFFFTFFNVFLFFLRFLK